MTQRAMIAAAAASLMSLAMVAAPVAAQEKEKCFGIAKAGQNDCANLSASHSCAGQSKLEIRRQRHLQRHERHVHGRSQNEKRLIWPPRLATRWAHQLAP
jgi:Predicted integral membrane protein (DUF2282)